jgi:hypothetical protein
MRRLAVIAAGFCLLVGPAAAETVERTVKANTRAGIGGFLGYEVDTCYPSAITTVTVRDRPANGNIQILPHEQVLGKDSRCPGTKVRGLAFVYTPNKGFRGADELTLDVPWQSTDSGPETIRSYTFRIRVE